MLHLWCRAIEAVPLHAKSLCNSWAGDNRHLRSGAKHARAHEPTLAHSICAHLTATDTHGAPTHPHGLQVVTGPVTGATFIDEAQGCTFTLASYQVGQQGVADQQGGAGKQGDVGHICLMTCLSLRV